MMGRDPKFYKNPEQFNPDRFMGKYPEEDPLTAVFGFGRRVCPGRLLAEASIRITEAMLIHSYDFKPSEIDGKPVDLECKSKGGIVRRVLQCR
jgi:cytochrome P450